MKFATTKERILKFIDYKDISVSNFLQNTGIKRGFLDKDKLKSTVSDVFIAKIIASYPDISVNWLVTGEGAMIKNVELSHGTVMMVPLINQYAYAGYQSGFADNGYVDSLPKIPVMATHQGRGKYIAIEVRGDSMDNGTVESILSKDIIVCREIAPLYWQQEQRLHFRKWKAFALVSKTDGIIVKEVIDQDTVNKTITIHSLNQEYPDTTLQLQEISQIFNVIQVIRDK